MATRGREFLADLIPRRGEHFTPAYTHHLAHRVPMLYVVVLVNMVVLSASFASVAPAWLALGIPAILFVYLAWRAVYWLPGNVVRRSLVQLERDVSNLVVIGPAAALVLVLWAISLEAYGDTQLQWLIHYLIAVTCFSAILGLGQSPITALRIALCVMVPSTIYLVVEGHPHAYAVAAVQTVVTILLLMITISSHRDFVKLELSRQQVLVGDCHASRLAETNRVQSRVDPLTGALNRRAIVARLEAMLTDAQVSSPWLVLVDLDGFKHINDTYGHATGDAVLCAVAGRLEAIPEIAAFGRLGGDEFAVLMSGNLNRAQVRAALERLATAVREPIRDGSQTLQVTCSMGMRRTIRGGIAATCLERADAALFKAKEQRCGIAEFTADDERVMQERRAITRVFHSADLSSQISLVYQPIVDSDTSRTLGFEALSRWSPDGQTWLLPGKFVDLAEVTGRIGDLTRTVLRKSLAECRVWELGRSLSLNLSAHDILRNGAADWLCCEVDDAAAPHEAIIFEITETALLTDYERAAANLRELRARGFRIALDDFGTGQSSLSHVHKLPLDLVKIDQSFAANIATDPDAQLITGTILTLARQLRLECVIEGIETEEQRTIARALGVRLMQGYVLGRPAPADEALCALEVAPSLVQQRLAISPDASSAGSAAKTC